MERSGEFCQNDFQMLFYVTFLDIKRNEMAIKIICKQDNTCDSIFPQVLCDNPLKIKIDYRKA